MRVIVCGAGRVGGGIATQLVNEGHHVTLVDKSNDTIAQLGNAYDMCTVVGQSSYPEILEAAGAQLAHVIIAVTPSDEVNMLTCQLAGMLFNIPTKICRIRHHAYLSRLSYDVLNRHQFPIDVVISPEREVARTICERFCAHGLNDIFYFANMQLKVVSLRIDAGSPYAHAIPSQLTRKWESLSVRLLGVVRNNTYISPQRIERFEEHDELYVSVKASDYDALCHLFHLKMHYENSVIIVGGGTIGVTVAEMIAKRSPSIRVKVIEQDKEQAASVSEHLKQALVLHGSGIDTDVLHEAGIETTDTIILVTNDDRVNILGGLLAKRCGVKRAIVLINDYHIYGSLVVSLGIDVVVSPRDITVSSVLRHCHSKAILSMHSFANGKAELLEIMVPEDSQVIGRHSMELQSSHPFVVGHIIQQDRIVLPEASQALQAFDRVLLLCRDTDVNAVEALFVKSMTPFIVPETD